MTFFYLKDVTKLDSQIQEIYSKNILINKLLENDFEVAIPVRDCGIDFIIYKKEKSLPVKRIQLKSFLFESFSFHKKYLHVEDLWFVFIMNLSTTRQNENQIIYGMSLEDVQNIIKTGNIKPNKKGYYYRKNISKELREKLKPFELNNNLKFRQFIHK